MEELVYRPRIVDRILTDKLEAMGAVLIEVAKWCGKTTTAEHAAKSVVYLSDTASLQQYKSLANKLWHFIVFYGEVCLCKISPNPN